MAYTTINKGETYFNTKLYTGNGSTQSITGVGFQPDWLWIKNRGTFKQLLVDSVRGATKHLSSSSDAAEITNTANVTSFDSDGFSLSSDGNVNGNTETYASWNWKAGTSFTNDASSTGIGTIDSTGSASDTAGFSIVSWTGDGNTSGTIKHGLSSTPKMIIVKCRNTTPAWVVYHASLGATKFLKLDQTAAEGTATNRWNDTNPTSSVFTVGDSSGVNGSTNTYIAYCFAEKKGYSKFGSYTGNGSADGAFVYTGFKPAFVIVKRSSDIQSWVLWDSKRDGYNQTDKSLTPNENGAEETRSVDFLSNGFKQRQNNTATNAASTYVYMAFAEFPFTSSTGTPVTAR